jgi:PiT family inorganic phosphate transporter
VASFALALAVFLLAQTLIHRTAQKVKNNRQGVSEMFALPLVLAAGFFAFAHGANDTANVAAPLGAIVAAAAHDPAGLGLSVPTWALAVAVLGIALGMSAHGGRLIRTVGSEITEIDKLRAFCVAVSAASVILLATHFGFPVSTTHTVVGSIFGVGLFREWTKLRELKTLAKIRKCHGDQPGDELEQFLTRFQGATLGRKRIMLESLFRDHGEVRFTHAERRRIRHLYHRQVLQRSLFRRILAFWMATLPASAALGALWFRLIGAGGD